MSVSGEQNQEILNQGVSAVKELFHFVNRYRWLPEGSLLKWIVRVKNWGAVSLLLSAAGWKTMFGLIQDSELTMEQSQVAIHT